MGKRELWAPTLGEPRWTGSGWPEENTLLFSLPVTYDFLATEDINRDRIQDVLFLYKNSNGSNNFNLSCTDEGSFAFT